MKFNWGTGLVIFFIIFISSLVFILYKSTQYDNALVIDNYYDEDIHYQSHYDKKQNTALLPQKVTVTYDPGSKTALITFPTDTLNPPKGNIWLYNPVHKSQDKNIPFVANKNMTVQVPLEYASTGRWKLKIDWTQGEKEYYTEEEILIQ